LLIERRADIRNTEKVETYYANLKRITQNKIENIKSTKEELNETNILKEKSNTWGRKTTRKPRTAFMKKRQEDNDDVDNER
jgi:hypothetical protein